MTLAGAARKASRITGLEVYGGRTSSSGYLLTADAGPARVEVGRSSPKEALKAFLMHNLDRVRDERMRETEGRCERCSKSGPLHLHHKKHRSQGRDDRPENLELLCVGCHDDEHGKDQTPRRRI